MKLYNYQKHAIRLIVAAFKAGKRRVLFTMPTGAGKTVVAVHMMQNWLNQGARILVISGRREHVEQFYLTLIAYGISNDDLSIILRKNDPRENLEARIQIASKDTLVRRAIKPRANVVIVDEAHHASADGYAALQAIYPHPTVWLGLTATPYRMTGRGLADVFDVLVTGAKPSELIKEKHLAEPRVFTVPEKDRRKLAASLKEVRTVGGEYHQGDIAKMVRRHRRILVGDLLRYYRKYGTGRATVVYAANLRHARQIVKLFVEAGISAELLTGKTDLDTRAEMIGGKGETKTVDVRKCRLATGVTQVVVNYSVLLEGWDCPAVKCVMMARPTRSLLVWIHACGRAMRKWNGQRPIILDHAGNALRAGIRCLPHEDLELSLVGGAGKRAGGKGPIGPKACPECSKRGIETLCKHGTEECPECGHVFVNVPEQVDGRLREMTVDAWKALRASTKKRVADIARKIGAPIAWSQKVANVVLKEE